MLPLFFLFCVPSIPAIAPISAPSFPQNASAALRRNFPRTDDTQAVLHSSLPYHEVRVPFREVRVPFRTNAGGDIIIKALPGGKPVSCIVDTGAENTVWAKSLSVKSRRTKKTELLEDAVGNRIPGRRVHVASLKLGDYEVRNLSGTEINDQTAAGRKGLPRSRSEVLLGNEAFDRVVLTIDYEKKGLLLREPDYDLTKQKRDSQALRQKFEWSQGTEGFPVIPCRIGTQVVRFGIDTAWAGKEIGITRRTLALRLPSLQKQGLAQPDTTPRYGWLCARKWRRSTRCRGACHIFRCGWSSFRRHRNADSMPKRLPSQKTG